MTRPITVRPVVVVHELHSGGFACFPVADPTLVSYAQDEEACLLEQRLFLASHLVRVPDNTIADFELSTDVRLVEVDVLLERGDLPNSLQLPGPIQFPCVVVDASWVVVVPTRQVCHVGKKESVASWLHRKSRGSWRLESWVRRPF